MESPQSVLLNTGRLRPYVVYILIVLYISKVQIFGGKTPLALTGGLAMLIISLMAFLDAPEFENNTCFSKREYYI